MPFKVITNNEIYNFILLYLAFYLLIKLNLYNLYATDVRTLHSHSAADVTRQEENDSNAPSATKF